eukprot:7883572-Ditylum_brightwellii.AAC.1
MTAEAKSLLVTKDCVGVSTLGDDNGNDEWRDSDGSNDDAGDNDGCSDRNLQPILCVAVEP